MNRSSAARLLTTAVLSLLACTLGVGSHPAKAEGLTAVPVDAVATCFTAKGPDAASYLVYGRRYSVGHPTAATPAIVLVHGVDSNASTWDLTPTWSVARSLAREGYVVVAYDRLGFRHSPYTGVGGGNALTVAAQQSVLHDVVTQLHKGSYATAPAGQCGQGAKEARTTYASARVAIIGHSLGGFIVSSYPGTYHDVVAMVQANAPSGLQSTAPLGNAALLNLTSSPAHGANDDKYGTVGDASHDSPPPAAPAGYTYDPGPARVPCEEFTLWRARAIREVVTVMCNPKNSTATPKGESMSLEHQAIENNLLIPMTGSIPVLLADADHDGSMPGDANALELSAWKGHCGCDVSQFILKDTGHAFMAHTTVTTWIANVTTWLARHGIAGTVMHASPRAVPMHPTATRPATSTALGHRSLASTGGSASLAVLGALVTMVSLGAARSAQRARRW